MAYTGKKPVDFVDVTQSQSMTVSDDLTVDTNTLYVDSTNNRVGVGTSSPDTLLNVESSTFPTIRVGDGIRHLEIRGGSTTQTTAIGTYYAGSLTFATNSTERMRIDSSGKLIVGSTTALFGSGNDPFFAAYGNSSTGGFLSQSYQNVVGYFNRAGSDGTILEFRKDNTTVGSIGAVNGRIYIGSSNVQETYIGFNNNYVYPANSSGNFKDNAIDLGNASARYDDVYATNGTIQTSDRNEKQDIEELSEAERRVAVACKGLLRKFRWRDAVAEKGDDARIHFGIIAQDLQDAFAAEGLDAGRYAMFISSTWWEKEVEVPAVEADEENGIEAQDAYMRVETYDEPQDGAVERTRLGVRYPELLAFIIGAM